MTTSTCWSVPSASKPHDKTTKRKQNPHYGHHNGLTQLSQLAENSEYYQGEHCESLHYRAGVWTGTMLAGAVMRGGGCGGRSSLSCLTRSFCSAPSSV